jgi:hypothetical protein
MSERVERGVGGVGGVERHTFSGIFDDAIVLGRPLTGTPTCRRRPSVSARAAASRSPAAARASTAALHD